MNCNKAERFMVRRVDGELSKSRSLRLDDHLRVCPECRRFSEQLQTLTARVRAAGEGGDDVADGSTMDRIWEGVRIDGVEAARELKAGEVEKRTRGRWKREGLWEREREREPVFLGLPDLALGAASLLAGLFIGSWFFFSAYGFPGSLESSKTDSGEGSERVAKTRSKKTKETREFYLKEEHKGTESQREVVGNNAVPEGQRVMRAASASVRDHKAKSQLAELSLVADAFGDEGGLGLRLNLNGVYCEPGELGVKERGLK